MLRLGKGKWVKLKKRTSAYSKSSMICRTFWGMPLRLAVSISCIYYYYSVVIAKTQLMQVVLGQVALKTRRAGLTFELKRGVRDIETVRQHLIHLR